ncbi:MAG: TonB family protein, partial [Arenimonas sp.]
ARLPHQLIYPGDAFYPDALAKSGVQGEVRLEIKLSSEGKASVVKMLSNSKSAELDKNAINFVNTGYYKLPDNGLKYFEGNYSLNIVFIRDSVLTINAKTCADFNTDLAYFRSTRSGETMKNLGIFELVTGIFTVQLMKSQGADGTLKFVKAVDVINSDIVAACAKKPAELFIKTYVGVAKKRGIKF